MNMLNSLISIDYAALLVGMLTGTLVSTGYFAGLSLSIERALSSPTRSLWLAGSAAIRITLLLVIGWLMAELFGFVAALGYGLAFLMVRKVMIHRTRKLIARDNS